MECFVAGIASIIASSIARIISKSQKLAEKTKSVRELIQSRKWSEILEKLLDQLACLKNWLFGEPFQSKE